jgi:hypothetical protein
MYVIWNECFIIKNKIAKHFHLQENVYFLALLLTGLLGLLSGDLHLSRWTIDGTLYDGGDESFLISGPETKGLYSNFWSCSIGWGYTHPDSTRRTNTN